LLEGHGALLDVNQGPDDKWANQRDKGTNATRERGNDESARLLCFEDCMGSLAHVGQDLEGHEEDVLNTAGHAALG
jgi:hypothetical protein